MASGTDRGRRRVVVTGMGVLSPVGLTAEDSWQAVLAGTSGVGPITLFDSTAFDVHIAAEVKGFDPEARVGRKEARRLDRFCQFALVAAIDAVADAQLDMDSEDAERVGVLVGSGIGGIGSLSYAVKTLNEKGPNRVSPFLIPMLIIDMASGVISMKVGAKGPNHSVVSACTTGAHAIGDAAEIIRRGDADVMLAGGAEAAIVPVGIAGFANMKALSTHNAEPQRASRPFDANRDGFICAEGAAVVVLESVEHAVARGAHIYGELLGYGNAADAYDMVHPAPEGEGLARAMVMTLKDAGVRPDEVSYINAHGTSTPLNDAHETMAIKRVFGERVPPVSSTKSMTGHLLGAAGSLEAVFALLALRDNVMPPTTNYETPDPACDLDYVPNAARKAEITYALSNNSGFGGHNTGLLFGRYAELGGNEGMGKESKKSNLTLVTDAPPAEEAEAATEAEETDTALDAEIEPVAPWSTWLDANRQTLRDLHKDMQYLIKGVPGAGLNWQPGANTNSLWALTLHTLGATLHLLSTAADIEPHWQDWKRAVELAASGDDPGLLLTAIRNMDDFLDKVFPVLEEEDPAAERDWLGKPRPVSYLVAHTIEHAGRHVGHMELTRQLWDQRAKKGR